MFHVVASTGRTATSFIAQFLNELPGVTGCHEGHVGNDSGPDALPMINLENHKCFAKPDYAEELVAKKRNDVTVAAALREFGGHTLVDVAYYNSMIVEAVLKLNALSRAYCLVRDCESFVRSATWITGEDPMPVGWPDPGKELSAREKFIAMGRIRPVSDPEKSLWSEWTSIERNIWLWQATNQKILDAKSAFPERVTVLDFASFKLDLSVHLETMLQTFGIGSISAESASFAAALDVANTRLNRREDGYQISGSDGWSGRERKMLEEANTAIQDQLRAIDE